MVTIFFRCDIMKIIFFKYKELSFNHFNVEIIPFQGFLFILTRRLKNQTQKFKPVLMKLIYNELNEKK
jgi:hypothetical protein